MDAKTKLKKANWSKNEFETLVCEYENKYDVLEGGLSISLTGMDKRKAWESVMDAVNSTSLISRTVDECKKKVSDLKVKARKKERARVQYERGTGGGPPSEELSPLEKKMLELLPLESVHGHEDGFDTFKPSSSASMHGLGNSSKSAVIEYKVDDSTPELSDIQCQQSQKAASVSSTPSKCNTT
ncbi:uncharacterized protein LOC127870131 [Dreissena polymorpha]|uniref:uncharacterized protein LOC127870131 n=1 Tax=Dreissena polymorpha TaxID=45954 RepID=UPI002265272B|nr:uncharacterized protein LOC127870131 [Dreissena polymorpha]